MPKKLFYVGHAPKEEFPLGNLGTIVVPGRTPEARYSFVEVKDGVDVIDHGGRGDGTGTAEHQPIPAAELIRGVIEQNPYIGLLIAVEMPNGKDFPTEAEFLAAEAELAIGDKNLIDRANEQYSKTGRIGGIPETAKRAAKARGLSFGWLATTVSVNKCEYCGGAFEFGKAVGPCGHIVNAKLYKELKEKEAAILGEVAAPQLVGAGKK